MNKKPAVTPVKTGTPAGTPASPSPAAAAATPGRVYLAGAGPGGLSLLTPAAREALSRADIIFYDRLIHPEILASLPRTAELTDVGKCGGNHPVPQSEINRLLGDAALSGKTVVRLKGGDPFVFGRGGEEMEYLQKLGIAVTAIPGITSGIAVPEHAGIPVTHRGVSRSVTLVTGHEAGDNAGGATDWSWYAKCPGTLVIYMGAEHLKDICASLLEGGMNPERKLAVIEHGFLPDERVICSTVGETAAGDFVFRPPAVVVVGDVAGMYRG